MDSLILFCTKCHIGFGGLVSIPPICPECHQETVWTTTAPAADIPRIAYLLTNGDRKLLKKMEIAEG